MRQHSHKGLAVLLPLMLLTLIAVSCEDNEALDTHRNTYSDDIADITFLNDAFYTCNYDLSGNAGSQIDLLRFEWGSNQVYLDDHFDLDMNGQGYLAITNDSLDIYLQSRDTELIIKCSTVGEKAFLLYDDVPNHWHPAGLSFHPEKDSLLALYRNSHQPQSYRLRTLDRNLEGPAGSDREFELDFSGRGTVGIYALAYHRTGLFMLGVDTTDADILVSTDHDVSHATHETLPDSTVVGLCFKGDDLFLSYRDRRISFWATYQ